MTDILIVNPPSPDKSIIIRDFNRSGRTSKEQIIWPQTSLAYLAAMVPPYLKVEIIDCIAEKLDWPAFIKILNEKKPRYVVSHVITSTAHNDLKIFEEAKKINPGTETITMGPHVTELFQKTLEENPALDYVMVKECELTFKELVENLEKKQSDLNHVKGLAWRNREGKIILNESRPFIKTLDDLPLPRHDLLPLNKYVFPFIASSFTFVMSGRGCPFACTFCRQPIMWSRTVRTRSAQSIIKELRWLKELRIKNFIFHSDIFTIYKDITKEICQMMIDEKLNLSWACNSRVDTVDEETLQLMKKAGCWMIAFGFESGSQKALNLCEKNTTIEQGKKVAELANKIGIKIYGYFIIGLIGETKETIKETINFAKNLPITFAIFHVASPYPGTNFYQQVKNNGWLISEEWENVDQGGTSPIDYPQLTSKEIMKGIKKAYWSFYLRPGATLKILTSIKNFSDLKHFIRAGFGQLFWK